jgi:hypothetical protein
MWKMLALAVAMLALWTTEARAVDIKNARAIYGPFGATRPNLKILPGEIVIIEFDITNLPVDAKTGIVKYETNLKVFDPKGKQIINENDKKGVVLGLGGNTVPERAHCLLGMDVKPGKYKLIVTVTADPGAKSSKLEQELEVLPPDFGFIHIVAPAMGFVGQDLPVEFAVVGMGRDAKGMPKIVVTSKVLDESGKPTTDPMVNRIPDELPKGVKADQEKLFRLTSPILLNRPGTFTFEITAVDEISKKKTSFSYKFKVLDASK